MQWCRLSARFKPRPLLSTENHRSTKKTQLLMSILNSNLLVHLLEIRTFKKVRVEISYKRNQRWKFRETILMEMYSDLTCSQTFSTVKEAWTALGCLKTIKQRTLQSKEGARIDAKTNSKSKASSENLTRVKKKKVSLAEDRYQRHAHRQSATSQRCSRRRRNSFSSRRTNSLRKPCRWCRISIMKVSKSMKKKTQSMKRSKD